MKDREPQSTFKNSSPAESINSTDFLEDVDSAENVLECSQPKEPHYQSHPNESFHFKSLLEITDSFVEAKNEELKKYSALEDHSKLPTHRRLQINFILEVLRALKHENNLSPDRKNIIATGVIRLQKLLIYIEEYNKNLYELEQFEQQKFAEVKKSEQDSSVYQKVVNYLKNTPENSLMFKANDEIIGHNKHNNIHRYQTECFLALRNYLLENNELNLTSISNHYPKAKVINFIQDCLFGLKIRCGKAQNVAPFNHTTMKKYFMKDIQLPEHKLKPTKTLDLKHKFLTEIENFDRKQLKHVETIEKHPVFIENFNRKQLKHVETKERRAPLVMKVFKPKSSHSHTRANKLEPREGRETRSHKKVPPNSPANP